MKLYTEEQVKILLKEQRGNCVWAVPHLSVADLESIKNAKEPKLPEEEIRGHWMTGSDNISKYRLDRGGAEDVKLIKEALHKHGWIKAGLNDAEHLWEEYSDTYAAGWLGLPKDHDEIYQCIKNYI